MNRNLLAQVSIPVGRQENAMLGFHESLYRHSRHSLQDYAQRIGADYICIAQPTLEPLHPTFERFQLFDNIYDRYDLVAYVDCDVVAKHGAPSIFDECTDVSFAAFPEGAAFHGNSENIAQFTDGRPLTHLIKRRLDKGYTPLEEELLSPEWMTRQYFNAGVLVMSREMRRAAREHGLSPYLADYPLNDQTALNRLLFDTGINVSALSYRFNGLFHIYESARMADVIAQTHLVHFAGPMKNVYDALVDRFGEDWPSRDFPLEALRELVPQHAKLGA